MKNRVYPNLDWKKHELNTGKCYGSGSESGSVGSVCFWASWIQILLSSCKNSKKNLRSYCFVTSLWLFFILIAGSRSEFGSESESISQTWIRGSTPKCHGSATVSEIIGILDGHRFDADPRSDFSFWCRSSFGSGSYPSYGTVHMLEIRFFHFYSQQCQVPLEKCKGAFKTISYPGFIEHTAGPQWISGSGSALYSTSMRQNNNMDKDFAKNCLNFI